MKTLLTIGDTSNYTVEDFYEGSGIGDEYEGTKEEFISEYTDSDEFYNWVADCNYFDEEYIYEQLNDILKKTRIKNGFLEIMNGGWRKQHGHTEPFEINAQNVISKISLNGDSTIEVKKDGHQLSFTRYSHDEPTGATIYLRSNKDYSEVVKEIEN